VAQASPEEVADMAEQLVGAVLDPSECASVAAHCNDRKAAAKYVQVRLPCLLLLRRPPHPMVLLHQEHHLMRILPFLAPSSLASALDCL
jgi:hypothetical protein